MDKAGKMNTNGYFLTFLLQTKPLHVEKVYAVNMTEHAIHTAVCRLLSIHWDASESVARLHIKWQNVQNVN
jgi:hypothetical protein